MDELGLSVRAGREEDAPAIRSIGIRTYVDHFSAIWGEEGLSRYLERHFAEDHIRRELRGTDTRYLVAYQGGEAIGFAKLNFNAPLPSGEGRGAELQKIYFLKGSTGRGYGESLLKHCLSEAVARDEPFIWLDVLKSNAGARAFYEKHGFKLVGEKAMDTDRMQIGLFVLARPLR